MVRLVSSLDEAKQCLVGVHCSVDVYYYCFVALRLPPSHWSPTLLVAGISISTASLPCPKSTTLHLFDHLHRHFQVSSFLNKLFTMLSTSCFAVAALIVGGSIQVAATPFDPIKDVLLGLNTRDANLTKAVHECVSLYESVCTYASTCGDAMCDNCLGLFPLLSNCCDVNDGKDLDILGIDVCMYQYAVWTEDGNGDVVSIYPSLSRPPPPVSTSTDVYTYTDISFTSTGTAIHTHTEDNTSTVPIPFATGAAAAAATTSGASPTVAASTNGATASPPPAVTTKASGAPSQTSAAASGPTTSNGVDRLIAGDGQQLGIFGAVFMGMISLFLL
jgi:hypothetical protein